MPSSATIPPPANIGRCWQLGLDRPHWFDNDIAAIAEQLHDKAAIMLPEIIAPDLARQLAKMLEPGFSNQTLPDQYGRRLVEKEPKLASRFLQLLLNRPDIVGWMSQITQCPQLRQGDGEVAEFRGKEDYLPWHDDLHEEARRFAFVIDLSTSPYEGGEFELRLKNSRRVITRSKYTEFGNATLFKINPHLEHQVRPVTSGVRRVYATSFAVTDQ